MPRAAKNDDEIEMSGDVTGEYKRPDAKGAFKIFDKDIKPKLTHIATLKGDLSEPYKTIKNDHNFPRPILNFLVMLENMEDAKRDHYLIALNEGLRERRITMPNDLVTMAQAEAASNIIPLGERRDPGLATLAEEEFEEATEEELAAQQGRKAAEAAE